MVVHAIKLPRSVYICIYVAEYGESLRRTGFAYINHVKNSNSIILSCLCRCLSGGFAYEKSSCHDKQTMVL